MAERVRDGDEFAEIVVGVGRTRAGGIDCRRATAVGVVFRARRVAAAVDGRAHAAKRVVDGRVRDRRERDLLKRNAVAGTRAGDVRRLGDAALRGRDAVRELRPVLGHVAADVGRARAVGVGSREAGELRRARLDERGDGRVGAGGDVRLDGPDVRIDEGEIGGGFRLAPFDGAVTRDA